MRLALLLGEPVYPVSPYHILGAIGIVLSGIAVALLYLLSRTGRRK